ncbi:MAG TPA: DUF6531 domain-containing protein, partial [Sedimentisphaerales bacterium]|nr:DUF6531 domain-containing protein [Sedimentisphaerales bacterium]
MKFINFKNIILVLALFSVFIFNVNVAYCCIDNIDPGTIDPPTITPPPTVNPNKTPATGYQMACGADPVILINGKYALSATDFVIPGRAMSVVFERHYISGDSGDGIVSFEASGAFVQQGEIIAYYWRFPDEAFDIKNADTATPSCKFTTGGTYSISHRIQDSYGNFSDYSDPCEFELPRTKDNSRFGYGWDMCYNIQIRRIKNTNSLYYYDGEGNSFVFNRVSTDPNRYEVPQGYKGYIIEDENGLFTHYKENRIKYCFNQADNIAKIEDKNGNNISFSYTPSYDSALNKDSYKLTTITDDLGRDIDLTYNDAGLLSSVTDFMNRTWNYVYDIPTHDLIRVERPDKSNSGCISESGYPKGCIEYIYNINAPCYYFDYYGIGGDHDLLSIIDPNTERYIQNDYTDGKVTSQDYGNGTFTLEYDTDVNSATITDRKGNTTTKTYNYKGNPLTIIVDANSLTGVDEAASYVTTY